VRSAEARQSCVMCRKESRIGATEQRQQIEREFRTKVQPVLNHAQVVISVNCDISVSHESYKRRLPSTHPPLHLIT